MTPSYRVTVTPVASGSSGFVSDSYVGVITASRPGIAADRGLSVYANRNHGRAARWLPKGEILKIVVERIA